MKRIHHSEIEGLTPIAEGYKVIKYDGSTKGEVGFTYGKKGENITKSVWKCEGGPIICKNGAHFCENPAHITRFYEPLGYNRYFKVKAYGKVAQDKEKEKSCAQIIEFVEEFEFMDFMKMLSDGNNCSDGNNFSNGNNHSNGNSCSDGNNYSDGNSCSDGNNCSNGTSMCYGLLQCKGAYLSVFCHKKNGIAYHIFNRETTEQRAVEVLNHIGGFHYIPKWDNITMLKEGKEWTEICWPELRENDTESAWCDMPAEMLGYIRSLPEFDAQIFKKITGIGSEV
jgi:hypothetical protein